MKDESRKRALDSIEFLKDQWHLYNPLFRSYNREIDLGFDRGTLLDLDYYVPRKFPNNVTFEDMQCNMFFILEGKPNVRMFFLMGMVGSGKTSFIRYTSLKLLPKIFPTSLTIYPDAWNIFNKEDKADIILENTLLETIEKEIIERKLYNNQKEYLTDIFENLGYVGLDEKEIIEKRNSITLNDVLLFLKETKKIEHLLFVFDNTDENPLWSVKKTEILTQRIFKFFRENPKKNTTIIIPLRTHVTNWSRNRYYDQEKYSFIDLPPLDEKDIVKSKLEHIHEAITSSARDFSHELAFTKYDRTSKEKSVHSIKITIKKESIIEFIKLLIDHLMSLKEPEFFSLVRELAAGNLKILVSNMYNIIHSASLPLIPLFEKVFTPDDAIEYRKKRPLFPQHLAFYCLMTVNYPFFDIETSNIVNVFNLRSELRPNEFRNTLTIPRLLNFLNTHGKVKFKEILSKFVSIDYYKDFIKDALSKCLFFGLIQSDIGNKIEHFNDETSISLTKSANLYLDTLIFEPSYLQFVCEDTPMPVKYIIPIEEKYDTKDSYGSKQKRMRSVKEFINFIEEEEKFEQNEIVKKKMINEQDYLIEMSYKVRSHGKWIHEVLTDRTLPIIDKIV